MVPAICFVDIIHDCSRISSQHKDVPLNVDRETPLPTIFVSKLLLPLGVIRLLPPDDDDPLFEWPSPVLRLCVLPRPRFSRSKGDIGDNGTRITQI